MGDNIKLSKTTGNIAGSDIAIVGSVPCSKGQYLDQTKGCQNCPNDQWSEGGGVSSCKNCPPNKGVEEGKGTSEDSCTFIPCSKGQYLDQTKGCQNCPNDQ